MLPSSQTAPFATNENFEEQKQAGPHFMLNFFDSSADRIMSLHLTKL